MPQWSRDRELDRGKYPDERWFAEYSPVDREVLLSNDHHTVRINGRVALLLTYAGAVDDEASRANPSRRVVVSFTYPRGHPAASAEVQALVDRLTFAACG